MAILVNGGVLPRGGVASGRVCACSLRSRLVSTVTYWAPYYIFNNKDEYLLLAELQITSLSCPDLQATALDCSPAGAAPASPPHWEMWAGSCPSSCRSCRGDPMVYSSRDTSFRSTALVELGGSALILTKKL